MADSQAAPASGSPARKRAQQPAGPPLPITPEFVGRRNLLFTGRCELCGNRVTDPKAWRCRAHENL